MKKYALLGVADANYLTRYIVAFDSFIQNTTVDYDVFILAIDPDKEDADLIANYFRNKHGKRFEYLSLTDTQKERIAAYPKYTRSNRLQYITETTLYKWFGFELVRDLGYDAVVYIDPDTLTVSSADEYFSIAETVESLAAVPHSTTIRRSSLNAGMLIVNTASVTDTTSAQYDATVHALGGNVGDQAVFNDMFVDTYTKLDQKFNRTSDMSTKLVDDTIMIHFTGGHKPWNDLTTLDLVKDTRVIKYRTSVADRMGGFIEYNLPIKL